MKRTIFMAVMVCLVVLCASEALAETQVKRITLGNKDNVWNHRNEYSPCTTLELKHQNNIKNFRRLHAGDSFMCVYDDETNKAIMDEEIYASYTLPEETKEVTKVETPGTSKDMAVVEHNEPAITKIDKEHTSTTLTIVEPAPTTEDTGVVEDKETADSVDTNDENNVEVSETVEVVESNTSDIIVVPVDNSSVDKAEEEETAYEMGTLGGILRNWWNKGGYIGAIIASVIIIPFFVLVVLHYVFKVRGPLEFIEYKLGAFEEWKDQIEIDPWYLLLCYFVCQIIGTIALAFTSKNHFEVFLIAFIVQFLAVVLLIIMAYFSQEVESTSVWFGRLALRISGIAAVIILGAFFISLGAAFIQLSHICIIIGFIIPLGIALGGGFLLIDSLALAYEFWEKELRPYFRATYR